MTEPRDLLLRSGVPGDWQSLYRNLWCRPEPFRYLFSRSSLDETASQLRTERYIAMHHAVKTEFFVVEKATQQVPGML